MQSGTVKKYRMGTQWEDTLAWPTQLGGRNACGGRTVEAPTQGEVEGDAIGELAVA
jgi:hypothetical protein